MSSSRRSNPEDDDTGSLVKTAAKLTGVIGAVGLGAPLAWIGYSTVAIPHKMPLPPAVEAEQRTFQTQHAGRLSYYVDSRGQGRPLVLLHSINAAASSYEMKPLFEYFQGRRPVYALDLPGFGFSERIDLPWSPELYASAVLEFLQREVPEGGVDVIAQSLSSEFAARAAARAHGLIHSLAMISPSGFSDGERSGRRERTNQPEAAERRERILSNPLWAQAIFDLLASRPSIHYFLSRSFEGPVNAELERYSYLTSHQPGARFAPLAFVSGRLFTPNAKEELYAPLRAPALVIYDQDGYVSFGGLGSFIASHPWWRARRVSPTRGLPQFEQLEATVQVLQDFWAELETTERGRALDMNKEGERLEPTGSGDTLIASRFSGTTEEERLKKPV